MEIEWLGAILMIKSITKNVKHTDKHTLDIMLSGFKFSFIICIISCIISLLYITNPISHILYESSIILFKTGLTFAITFFICAFAIDKIKKMFWQM